MVFSSSLPAYLDPHNWQQQQPSGGIENNQLPPPVPLPPPLINGDDHTISTATVTRIGSVRPGSMAERARMAKVPQPEAALRCPRCDSTNTKFCYFNNYSLIQPRHFCKSCRRYWTRGGSLRNVPVGGGCRRNKRSKKTSSTRSKSPIPLDRPQVGSCSTTDLIGHFLPPPTQLPLLPSLPHLSDYGSGDLGLSFTRIQPLMAASGGDMEFQIGNSSCGGGGGGGEQWRLQNFPFLAGLETPSGLYPFEGNSVNSHGYTVAATGDELGSKPFESVKIEENQGVNMSRNFLGLPGNDHQYWGTTGNGIGNAWTDLSGFTSTSSTSHLL